VQSAFAGLRDTHAHHSGSLFVMTPDALASASAIILIISLAALALLRVLSSSKDTTRKGRSHGEDKGDVDGHELKVVILYGTQTGTSERFAKEVEEELLQRYDKAVRVQTSDLEAVTSDRAEDRRARCCCSRTRSR
jgi:NADPH-ferrihemoprotein reductase